jgi:hypothetical protein
MKHEFFLTAVLVALLTACAPKDAGNGGANAGFSEQSMEVETVSKSLNSASGNGDSSAQQSSSASNQKSVQLCSIASLALCQNGERSATFDSCTDLFTGGILSGDIKLDYSEQNCSMQNSGDSVTRTVDVSYTARGGWKVEVSSADHATYDGVTVGGGGRLTYEGAASFKAKILGEHRKLIGVAGRVLIDHSIHSSSDVNVSAPSADIRVVDGGSIELSHNLAKYTASFSPHSLTFSAGCCYPISGTLDLDYAGSIRGSAQVVFQGCGSAKLVRGGTSANLTFNECDQ